jgi:hypothetical protein
MSSTIREIIKGSAGGAAFLASALVMDMPFVLAGIIGLAVYIGLGFLLPRLSSTDGTQAAPGLSVAERDKFLGACRKSAADLHQIAAYISNADFADCVKGLVKTVGLLIAHFERKPETILLAWSVPQNLERLTGMLSQYVAISSYEQPGPTAEEALKKVEDIARTVGASFKQVYQQLLHNDVAALEASAHTLGILMGAEAEFAKKRRSQIDSPYVTSSQVPPPRRPHKQKEL